MDGFRKWLSGGMPWIWLQAAAVAACILLVAGLLALIGWRGLGHFWPSGLHEWTVRGADGGQHLMVGQLRRSETVSAERLREAGRELPEEMETVTRHLVKVGNRDLYGQDFTWVLEPDILARSQPRSLVVLQRETWGDFFGWLVGLEEEGALVVTDDAWSELGQRLARTTELRAQIDTLERDVIGSINYRLERLRLEERRLELDDRLGGEAHAELQTERAALQSEFDTAVADLESLYDDIARDSVIMRDSGGDEQRYPLSGVLDAWQPNTMGARQKTRHWLGSAWRFLADDPREANTEGGIFPALYGTVLMVMLMTVFVTPLGVIGAVYLREYAPQGAFTSFLRIAVNNLAGVPSIVYGVFGLGFFIYTVGGGIDRLFFSEALPAPTFGTGGLFWAALTLALLTLPVVIVSTEEGLARIPRTIREGSLALGATRWETLWRTILPMATPGILTGVILAVARAAGEVAPLMLVGVVKLAPSLPLDGDFPYVHFERKFMHLGFHIYDVGFQSPNVEAARPLVYATALLLVIITLLLNLVAIGIRNRLRERYRGLET
ncbi:phosphate ABC transporter permease PstA [Marinihelvus fidelis]|uniref:Phosphate transport system permease protein PstA n=1 Tax=Marinihelvus fidelis TaxID=2613842 RepID=A0A5N0T4U3_9GAMM|nr:phosphate ABC transporter permease PstA [Marinihelvus fidelis]KAA9129861.1 phosphate ABC transporter permease PstA [Marinihelvus fidelis]